MSSGATTSGTNRDVPVGPTPPTTYRPVTPSGPSYKVKASPPERKDK